MARKIITPKLIEEMNELYLVIQTYAGVSRELGGSPAPSTVKKYIIPNYVSRLNLKKKEFHKEDMPEFTTSTFEGVDDWGSVCTLSEEEKDEITELWEELAT